MEQSENEERKKARLEELKARQAGGDRDELERDVTTHTLDKKMANIPSLPILRFLVGFLDCPERKRARTKG